MIGQVFSYRFDQSFIYIIKSKQTFELTKHLHHRKKKRIYADYKSNQKRYRTMLVAKLTQGGHFGLTQPTISDRKASESRGIIIIRQHAQEQEGNQWRFQAPICQNMSEGPSFQIQKRKMLVKMVQEEGLSIVASVKRLKIKLTTARLILQKYRKNGTFPMRKFKKIGKMLLDLPDDVKKEQNQLLIKQQHKEEHLIKEEFSGEESEASEDSISAEDVLPEQSLDDVKIEE